jgi:hypothetical protein
MNKNQEVSWYEKYVESFRDCSDFLLQSFRDFTAAEQRHLFRHTTPESPNETCPSNNKFYIA